MTDAQQREAARQFYYKWNGKGREDEDARSYWIDILQNIFGITNVTDRVHFEKKVAGEKSKKRIDVYIPETHVLIEQKSLGIALDKPQPGHDNKTPFEQAKEYDNLALYDDKAKWIVTSNFAEIWIYDMSVEKPSPVKLQLSDLQTKYHTLDFLVNKEISEVSIEMKVSLEAGDIVGELYDALQKQYKKPKAPESLKSLNRLCVRIVFCLFAEDAGIFKKKALFHDYLSQFDAKGARKALVNLFKVLDTKVEDRERYLEDDDPVLASFPYVNGGLFRDEPGEEIEIPPFTDAILQLLLKKASHDFDWSAISPTIFGAVFESTLNAETRKNNGMHYTAIENIHKVIDPLFLNDLTTELEEYLALPIAHTWRTRYLKAFQEKLASLRFLDPACGSGNFLTESYLSIRKLENRVIRDLQDQTEGQIFLEGVDEGLIGIKVSIDQFAGIEINDFAVSVAKTAMWIAEAQMMQQTKNSVDISEEFLPLTTGANIVEGDAILTDWNDVVPSGKLSYIMGNPPFYGASKMSKEQKAETVQVIGKGKRVNSIDYVGAWYYKAAAYIQGTTIRCALVSTNSITQGEQVAALWTGLLNDYKIHIDFAYRTFRWDSEANIKAHVHCVIIGFSVAANSKPKQIWTEDGATDAANINPYLIDAPNVLVESRGSALYDVPRMTAGNKPADGGHLILTEEERNELLKHDGSIEPCLRRYVGSKDFINNDESRYCLWLKGIAPSVYRKNKDIMQRLDSVREMRLASSAAPTRAYADKPYLFFSTPQTEKNYLAIPEVSSEKRIYIPIGFMDKSIIASNKLLIVPDASIYHFGVLTSNVHMAWTRAVCGRLEMRYQYSGAIVYNTFPWPEPTDAQKAKIVQTAQAILDARALYPDASLADLYDPNTMPPELLKAHQANDRAVMQAYGMPIKETDEAACVAWLMKLYQEKVDEQR